MYEDGPFPVGAGSEQLAVGSDLCHRMPAPSRTVCREQHQAAWAYTQDCHQQAR